MTNGNILLMDDSEIVLEVLGAKLEDHEFSVVKTNLAQNAIEHATLGTESFDLFILDIRMPDIDGFKVVEVLRNHPVSRDVPILLLTSLEKTEDKVRGLEVGADDFLNKTVSDAELIARVRSLVSLGKLRERLTLQNKTAATIFETQDIHEESSTSNERVLIVHERAAYGQALLSTLDFNQWQVHLETETQKALALLRQKTWDVLITSFALVADGQNSPLKALEESENSPSVLIVDHTPSPDHRIAAFDAGADEYIPAETPPEEICARVASIFRRLRRYRAIQDGRDLAMHAAITDPLTGLYNHGYFEKALSFEIERARRFKHLLTLIVLDLDHFKQVNDQYGHLIGDRVLLLLADLLRSTIRISDISSRYGGEEFTAILPNTSHESGLAIADRIRTNLANRQLTTSEGGSFSITASFGVATFPIHAETMEELFAQADAALYMAKEAGRNYVVSASTKGDSQSQASRSTTTPVGESTALKHLLTLKREPLEVPSQTGLPTTIFEQAPEPLPQNAPAAVETSAGEPAEMSKEAVSRLAETLTWMLPDGEDTPLSTLREVSKLLFENTSPNDEEYPQAKHFFQAADTLLEILQKLLQPQKTNARE